MKLSAAIFIAILDSASSFTLGTAAFAPSWLKSDDSITALGASRNREKIMSRSKWAAARGFNGEVAKAASISAGLMKNDLGLEYVKLVHPSGSSSEVYLYGGVVTSYIDSQGVEYIAVRPDAKMDGSKPISGGLSHCWPQVRYFRYYILFHLSSKTLRPYFLLYNTTPF